MTVSKKRRLGRGLEALLGPTTVPEARTSGTLRQIPLTAIQPNPFQPRKTFSQVAIDELASLRGRLGGFQKDTIATTINSLRVARENITAAESAIRDADFAVETSKLTRAQIMVNSSTVVLQLSNAQPQNVLALLG